MKQAGKNKNFVFTELTAFIAKQNYSSVFILVDENTRKHCYPHIYQAFGKHEIIEVPSGEGNKTIETCGLIWQKLSELAADRRSVLINLGGGVVCDMGGFAASVYKRGIDFIHIPTTLLAMCDSCIGGKTAVDMGNIKNVIGTFSDAEAVFVYPEFLATLPKRYVLSGFAEMLKHSLIADKSMFSEFESLQDLPEDFNEYIFRSLKIKEHIVSLDPCEKKLRKSLNFGHTIGHALESFFLENQPNNYLTHGESIAAGMMAESHLAYSLKMIGKSELLRINKCITKFFKFPFLTEKDVESVSALCLSDKKNENGKILFSLPDAIGSVKVNIHVTISMIKKSLTFYSSVH